MSDHTTKIPAVIASQNGCTCTFEVLQGLQLTSCSKSIRSSDNSNLLIRNVAALLRICFEEMRGLSTAETLEEGIGFHHMRDTTWVLCYDGRHHHHQQQQTRILIGLVVTVDYHDGLYLSNFCVLPKFRNRGLGLDILEQVSYLAVQRNRNTNKTTRTTQNRLIGNAAVKDRFIVDYYKSLGADVVKTGVGSGNEIVGSSVRLRRSIPDTFQGVKLFYASLRSQRQKKRLRKRYALFTAVVAGAATAVFLARALMQKGRHHSRARWE